MLGGFNRVFSVLFTLKRRGGGGEGLGEARIKLCSARPPTHTNFSSPGCHFRKGCSSAYEQSMLLFTLLYCCFFLRSEWVGVGVGERCVAPLSTLPLRPPFAVKEGKQIFLRDDVGCGHVPPHGLFLGLRRRPSSSVSSGRLLLCRGLRLGGEPLLRQLDQIRRTHVPKVAAQRRRRSGRRCRCRRHRLLRRGVTRSLLRHRRRRRRRHLAVDRRTLAPLLPFARSRCIVRLAQPRCPRLLLCLPCLHPCAVVCPPAVGTRKRCWADGGRGGHRRHRRCCCCCCCCRNHRGGAAGRCVAAALHGVDRAHEKLPHGGRVLVQLTHSPLFLQPHQFLARILLRRMRRRLLHHLGVLPRVLVAKLAERLDVQPGQRAAARGLGLRRRRRRRLRLLRLLPSNSSSRHRRRHRGHRCHVRRLLPALHSEVVFASAFHR
eukprot:Rhum_TRINITY_DN11101_c0_g1::Rhum_TRINITY_DN11101_c0_g1_i1::g.42475::m.42475